MKHVQRVHSNDEPLIVLSRTRQIAASGATHGVCRVPPIHHTLVVSQPSGR